MTLRVLSYNIRFGGTGRASAIAAVVGSADADLVILQEASDPDVVASVADLAGFPHSASKKGLSLAFLSRREIASYRWHQPPGIRRAFLEIRLRESDLAIFGVHLSAVHSNWTERRRHRELAILLDLLASESGSPHLVAGDFNTLAPGELLDHSRMPIRLRLAAWATGGRLRYSTIQQMLDRGYIDSYRSLHDDRGFTFPTWDPHVRLDFAFVPAEFADRVDTCEVVTSPEAAAASDHFPLLTQLT
jgi:endonuclease/exonuclease/phosphatase family metal-dependent hydrolase